MAYKIQVERAKKDEYNGLLNLIDLGFGFSDENSKFIKFLPKLYKKENEPCNNNIVVRVNNELRAAVGLYYNQMHVAGDPLLCGGIGNVAVHPSFRGEGYMQLAMNYALQDMKQQKADISFLGGQRQRYQYFSFEQGGYYHHFKINSTNIKHIYGQDKKSEFVAKRLTHKDTDILMMIDNLYSSFSAFSERKIDSYFDILCSWRSIPYAVFSGDEFKGYFVISETLDYISEFKAVNEKDISELMLCALENSANYLLNFSVPPFYKEACDFFLKVANDFGTGHCQNFSVLNYKNVISAFLRLKASFLPISDGQFIILIHGETGDENLKISVQKGKVEVENTKQAPDMELGHLEAMRAIGSLYSEHRSEMPAYCTSWFPLPLFCFAADKV